MPENVVHANHKKAVKAAAWCVESLVCHPHPEPHHQKCEGRINSDLVDSEDSYGSLARISQARERSRYSGAW